MEKKYLIYSHPLNGYWYAANQEIIADATAATRYSTKQDAEDAIINEVNGMYSLSGPLEVKEFFLNV
ncbi:MAG: hypothetical protein ACK5OS_02540 [Chryseotalea sp.]